ncbi:MAG: hypothetical protein LBP89_04940 [Helicobacteraceae bacterium]|jgi:hypothetical protein|nr:hypothetical protein [Helicobacteraceae bacterium]
MLIAHLFAAFVLGGFILIDRLVLRRSFDQETLKPLYKKAIVPTAIAAFVLIVSGGAMLQNAAIYYAKAAFGLLTIALFFLCPFFNARFNKKARLIYRIITLLALIVTIVLAKAIAAL